MAEFRAARGRAPFSITWRTGAVVRWLCALIWVAVTVFPIWWMLSIVFTKGGSSIVIDPHLFPTSWSAGIDHIRSVAQDSSITHSYLVSAGYCTVQILGTLVVASMAAYEFALFSFPGKRLLFLVALAALMVPQAVTIIPLYRIVVQLGWLNSLQGLAVPGMASPLALFLCRQFMETLPRELLDAASVDGASHWTTYYRIVVPLSKNILVTIAILTFMATWGNYLWPLVVSSNPDWYTVSLTVAQYFGPQTYTTVDVVLTVAFLAALPPLVLFALLQRQIVEGIATSGLKG